MRRWNLTRGVLCAFMAILSVPVLSAQSTKPISFKGLVDALKTHGLSNSELAQKVKTRGVDFELSPDMESELRAVGADDELVVAVRTSHHDAPSTEKAKSVASPSPQPPSQLPASQPVASQPPPSGPPPEKSKASVPANAPVINSVREVKKLFIQRMPNDLDEYIKAELSRQMPGRLVVVLHLEDADAVMKGTATNRSGSVTITDLRGTAELWTGEAGDLDILHPKLKIHGGEKKVAERLVSSLKKAMQK